MFPEEFPGLVDGHIMGPDFLYVGNVLSGKSHQVLFDAQEDFSFDFPLVFAQEFKIWQQTA